MRIHRLLLILLVLSAAGCWAQVETNQVETGEDTRSLGDVARETRAHRQQSQRQIEQDGSVQQSRRTEVSELAAELSINNEDDYEGEIRELLAQQDFARLEHKAELARTGQGRFPGGVWKLYAFYEAVSTPPTGKHATEAEWDQHLGTLKRWNNQYPMSTTARIALAQTYLEYGSRARGTGYADTVTEEGWAKLVISTTLAEATLKEAAALPNKCPYYYSAMLQVALHGGWSKSRTRALMEEAMRSDPGFYHNYRLYANYLQPKWYGDPGEVEAFAREIADHLGGDEGSFVYFEIGSLLGCGPCGNPPSFKNMSWPRVKEGYAAMERMYGTNNLKMNRFAYMATAARDQDAARQIFQQIGDNWNRKLWRTQQEFENARNWALANPQ